MSIPEIVVKPRELTGKGPAGRMRRAGIIPSVVYGLNDEPKKVTVEPKAINRIIHSEKGMNTVMNLRLEDTEATRHVMIKSVDRHPVTDRLIHVDFIRIDMDKEIAAVIPVTLVGSPEGVKLGGVLTMVRHEVEITCLPKNLPGEIRVDVTGLGLDDALRISDLPQLEGVVYTLEANRVVAVVHEPDKEAEEGEGEAEFEEVVAQPAAEE